MKYVIVLLTLSAHHPCPPASIPVTDCADRIERMDSLPSLALCEIYAAWWREHISEAELETEDTSTAICMRKP